eukprot:TRINITY_DN9176_c0_g2_i1.p2 TRINITY_DN9176_c0_g2~~TRINITY_DN9176_c0_g2_i1.p2  ORF type:complete len:106 (-),score=0.89 TRINITY_DN9176_c0_g2_i1:536-814(-)
MDVGTMVYEVPHHRFVTVPSCLYESSTGYSCIYVSAVRQEVPHRRLVALPCRKVEGGVTVFVLRVDVCTMGQQAPDDWIVTVRRRGDECGTS